MHEILLDSDQKALFIRIVEAFRSVPRDARRKFMLSKELNGSRLIHPGFTGSILVYDGDIETMAEAGLLRVSYGARGTPNYDITPIGHQYYEHLQTDDQALFERVEERILKYLDSNTFSEEFAEAYATWRRALERLVGPESDRAMTEVGHLCREAMQHFATALVSRYSPGEVDPDPARTISRVRSVLRHRLSSEAKRGVAEALLSYWGTTSDLVQRQEHGAMRERDALVWEDGRRVVFHTAIVMYEIATLVRQA